MLRAALINNFNHAAQAHSQRVAAHLRERIIQAGGWLSFEQWMTTALYAPGLGYYVVGNRKLAEETTGEYASTFITEEGTTSNTASAFIADKGTTSNTTSAFIADKGTTSNTMSADITDQPPPSSAQPALTQRVSAPLLAGDFITAPGLTPLYGRTLAGPVAQILRDTNSLHVLEFGAGTGALAESLISTLENEGLRVQYAILEVSADLRLCQQKRLAPYGKRVTWLETLPTSFVGCVLGNEVLDAMPIQVFRWSEDGTLLERGVSLNEQHAFVWADRPASRQTSHAMATRMPPLPGYTSEIGLQAEAWIRSMGNWLHSGAALFMDYGFPQHEYYHPQRNTGTLICHVQHHTHDDPFWAPGLQDITAHIDFTAMADAALAGGLEVLGYTSQACFLINAGLLTLLADHRPDDTLNYARTVAPVQKLLAETEMGELFKVLAIGRNVTLPLLGFQRSDRRGQL